MGVLKNAILAFLINFGGIRSPVWCAGECDWIIQKRGHQFLHPGEARIASLGAKA